MNYKNFILIFLFIPLVNLYSQNNIKIGKYDGKIFSIVDSIGDFYIYKKNCAFLNNILDGEEYKPNCFTIEILKDLKFSKSKQNGTQIEYVFSNDAGETLVIQEFIDDTKEKITAIEAMPPCIDLLELKEKRYACFYVKDRYLVYFMNVKAENNYKMFNSIQSIKNEN